MSKGLKTAKTIFVGLDNGGKTSIINLLEQNLTLYDPMKPTFQASRSTQRLSLLGLDLVHWDLGGQEKYREVYFKEKNKYFTDISLLIFVIDVRDERRYNEALEYLKKILLNLKEIQTTEKPGDVETNIFVLFHKFDPVLKNKGVLEDNVEELKQKILGFNLFENFRFFKTSIYDNISILRAFSEGALLLSDKAHIIQELLKKYCKTTFSSAAMLFDTHCLIVDGRATKNMYTEILETMAPILSTGIERLENYSIDTVDIQSNINFFNSQDESENNKAIIFLQKMDIENTRLYLLTLSRNPRTKKLSYDYLDILADKLTNVIKSLQ